MSSPLDMSLYKLSVESHVRFSQNERGSALILAIGLLAVMSILAATLMTLTISETQLTSNYRDDREAFAAADRAVEYAITGAAISGDLVDLYNDNDSNGNSHLSFIQIGQSGLDPAGENTVRFIGAGIPPIGIGSDINKFQALNYAITTTGAFPVGSANPSRTVLLAQVAKVVPK